MEKILLVQTAFIGDVILATPLVEKLHEYFPEAQIDFLLRKGNEPLLDNHPFIHEVLVWDKKTNKYPNLLRLIRTVRSRRYDLVVNLQRFFSSGLLTVLSGAKTTVGFDKNPLSALFSKSARHRIGTKEQTVHEIERNHSLILPWTDHQAAKPKIYPSSKDFAKVILAKKYICIAPATVWFTKQLPLEKWQKMMDGVGEDTTIFLLGGPADRELCETLKSLSAHPDVQNLAGKLSILESAALMKGALMNFVNDSAPLHLTSAVNAPVTAVYCSTAPHLGFTPLSDQSFIVETTELLSCRPCGLHGRKACPKRHFKCSEIAVERLLSKLP